MSHSINLFFFKKYFKSNVVIKDVVSLKTTSCVRFGGGSAHKAALSTGLTESLRCQNFVRLHDVVLYHSDLYINCRKYVDKERFVVGVKRSRRRAPLANKFTIHGLKERALKYYAKALSFYYIMVRESLTAHDFMLHGVINEFIFFKKYIKRVGKFIRPRLYTKKRFLNRSSSQLSSTGLFINLENTEFIYKQLRRNTPPYALDISRVSKQVYKSTRGKSGRYVLRWRYLSRGRSFPFMFRHLKYAWTFSKKATFLGKYIDIIDTMVFSPERSLGVSMGRKAHENRKF